jgi:hypothetical protein
VDAELSPNIGILLAVLGAVGIELLAIVVEFEIVVVAVVLANYEIVVVTVIYESPRPPVLAVIGMLVIVLVIMATAMPYMRSGAGIIPVFGVTGVFVPLGEVEVEVPPCRV